MSATARRRARGEQQVVDAARRLARTNAAYRELFAGAQPATLDDVPPLTKERAAALFDQLVASTGITREAARRYLEGPVDPGNTFDGRHLVFSTSGSSGLPVYVAYDLADFKVSVAAFYERAVCSRTPPPERLAYIGLLDRYNGGSSWMYHLGDLMDVRLLDLFADPEQLYGELRAFRPQAILTRPHMLRGLGEIVQEARAPLEAPLLLSVGEALTPHEADEINRLWGSPPHNSYSTVETGPIGFQRDPDEEALELYDELSYVEVLDEHGRPITAAGVPGRIAVTPLYNRAFPLLRYLIGDEACWITPGEALSFPLGRTSDSLLLVGEGTSCTVQGSSLLSAAVPGVRRYRVVQTAPAVIRAEYEAAGEAADGGRQLAEALLGAVRAAGCRVPVAVETKAVESLPIDRKSGKIKLLVPLASRRAAAR